MYILKSETSDNLSSEVAGALTLMVIVRSPEELSSQVSYIVTWLLM